MQFTLVVLGFLVISSASAGVLPHLLANPIEGRIVGGLEAHPGQFPYQVGLRLQMQQGVAFCGGVLISNTWVLTAAHCTKPTSNATVILGAYNINDQNEKNRIELQVDKKALITHRWWNMLTLSNDIALIKLPIKVEFNDYIQPIALPAANNDLVGKTVVASGWGKDTDNATSVTPILRYGESYVISKTVCNKFYLGRVTDSMICMSGAAGTSTCNGDSGGPLAYINEKNEKTVVGLTSFGIALGCEKGFPGVFTRVSSFLDWIQKQTGGV